MSLPERVAEGLGYMNVRTLPTGEVAGIMSFMFTWGIIVGITRYSYRVRYCYESASEAVPALLYWDGEGDPPGPWVKAKGKNKEGVSEDRLNPLLGEVVRQGE